MYKVTVHFRNPPGFVTREPESFYVDNDHVPSLGFSDDYSDEIDPSLAIYTVDESVIQFHKSDIIAVYAVVAEDAA